jgi:hypothetical protein
LLSVTTYRASVVHWFPSTFQMVIFHCYKNVLTDMIPVHLWASWFHLSIKQNLARFCSLNVHHGSVTRTREAASCRPSLRILDHGFELGAMARLSCASWWPLWGSWCLTSQQTQSGPRYIKEVPIVLQQKGSFCIYK